MRLFFSLALLLPLVSVIGCSAVLGTQSSTSIYRCDGGRWFSVHRDKNTARIEYVDDRYSLARRPSSLGIKYASPEATLIIDGQFAAFATETVVDLEQCSEEV
jgi:hypothetical protein